KNRAAAMLDTELKEDRIDHEKLHLNSQFNDPIPFAMSGYKLGALKNHYYLTLTFLKNETSPKELTRREKGTGLFKKEAFAKTAIERIHSANSSGKMVKIALVDLPELKELLDHMSTDAAQDLMYEISAYLRDTSLGGDMAGAVQNGSYSLILDASVKPEQVMNQLFEITRRADPDGKGIHARAETISTEAPNLTEQDVANALLYTINLFAKTHGENFRINSLSDGYQVMLQETVKKISNFKNTVDSNRFQLAFQPIVDLKNGITHHHEVLVRFEGDTGFDNPFSFISFGEEAGVIGEFDLAMCQRTIEVLLNARTNGHQPVVAVNLSGKSLSSGLYLDALREITGKHAGVNKQLIFEITESAKISDFDAANEFLQELRRSGFLCCLDDFGVGESSFNYLRNLQVDFVKIDGSYVRESIATKRGTHLLKAMSGMCRELGIVTIGEMVEDEKVAHLLWENGVRFGQGYFFGKPSVDESTLAQCAQVNPYYHGILRAKSFR
ncbi:MAG: EAL domain-containing protein, partial [Alphaproteobacteria bacterium]|nr:EAL domain-containing protein [Alphaproteobacteria bacterium]